MTSFCIQFEKIVNGLLREAFWSEGAALIAEREGGNQKVSVLENGSEHWSTLSK